ncbi:MAG TPA: SH3 domain-containing protein [Rhizobiaceae bacterium]|nr:SH3 domain-containing protein [Rhizobiaceae bacterium]
MFKLLTLSVVLAIAASSVFADSAITTANLNYREGPGTNYGKLGTIPEGTAIDIGDCDAAGTWCVVIYDDEHGFASGKYLALQEVEESRPSWPRTYTTAKGGEIILFQPQATDWPNFTTLSALVATEYRQTKEAKPVFGVIGLTGKTVADKEAGNVLISDVTSTELDFSALDRNELADLSLEVGKLLPTGTLTVDEDRLVASLADYKRLGDVSDLKSDPPPIFISKVPAILVQTDGKEVIAPVKGVQGLSFVVNTNWDLFKVDADGSYYLRDEKSWLTSKSLPGKWEVANTPPDILGKLPDDDNWREARAAFPPTTPEGGKMPLVIYSDKPSELITFEGEPALEPVPGTGLEWASNSESDVFYRKADQKWYVLLSGRWFSSNSLDGPWVFATPDLPPDFQDIPQDAPYYTVRSSVPGTSESAEARLKASIPTMARVSTDGSVKVDVAYSGDPKFSQIDGTSLRYAVNTNEQVIQVGNRYFVLKDGVWFVGDSPTGPFKVATSIPDEIYQIPPSSPAYNVTYVRLYDTEDDAVWYGYTAGYLGTYLAWGALVYGTGWIYDDYWDYGWQGGYWPYYPQPVTYGVGAFYNPARGTFGRYGYAYGPFRGIAGGAAYNPVTDNYVRGGAVAGPAGERAFISAYNPRTGTTAFARGGQNVYGTWKSAGVKNGSEWARAGGGTTAAGGAGAHWQTAAGNRGFVARGRGGDVYAGRDGNVYRNQNGQWQKRTDGGWSPVQTPSTEKLKKSGRNFSAQNPDALTGMNQRSSAGQRSAQRGSTRARQVAPEHLGLDRAARQIGNQRALQDRTTYRPPTAQPPQSVVADFPGAAIAVEASAAEVEGAASAAGVAAFGDSGESV